MWHCLEHLHAVTYFADECRHVHRELGLHGFWMGYFAARAAPLGSVDPGIVTATFFNFAPSLVERALPDAWTLCDPTVIIEARRRAAASALRRLVPGVDGWAETVVHILEPGLAAIPASGRALFAANRDLGRPSDPVEALWQSATTLREHRGDGHTAVLLSRGVTGCEPHLLISAERSVPEPVLRKNRGWTEAEWDAARYRLFHRGLLDAHGVLTELGHLLRLDIEMRTDELAASAYDAIGDTDGGQLHNSLSASADAISRSGVIPYPNPIGLLPMASSTIRTT
jgi:hypothetical protein